jgi:hypothetical protein
VSRLARVLAAIAGIAVLAFATASPCLGSEATAQAREDCCKRQHCQHASEFGHSGASQANADRCCAMSERGPADRTEQSRLMPAAQTVSIIDRVSAALSEIEVASIPAPLRPPDPVPIHLLHSVFQI